MLKGQVSVPLGHFEQRVTGHCQEPPVTERGPAREYQGRVSNGLSTVTVLFAHPVPRSYPARDQGISADQEVVALGR